MPKTVTRCHTPFDLYAYDEEGFLYKANNHGSAALGVYKPLHPRFPRFRSDNAKCNAYFEIRVEGKRYHFLQEHKIFEVKS